MTAAVSPRCACGHVGFRHLADHGHCQARYCHCVRFKTTASAFIPDHLRTDDLTAYLRQKGER